MKNNKNILFCLAPIPTLDGASLIEINSKALSVLGFRHLPCSRERVGRPMAYHAFIKENNVHFIVVFDSLYFVYRLTEPLLLSRLKSYKMITALINHLNSMPYYYEPCSLSEVHYVQYFDFLGVTNA